MAHNCYEVNFLIDINSNFRRGWNKCKEEVGSAEHQEAKDERASGQAQSGLAEAEEAQPHQMESRHPAQGQQQAEEEGAEQEAPPGAGVQGCAKVVNRINDKS